MVSGAGREGSFEGLKSSLSVDGAAATLDHYRERVRSDGACWHPAPDACSVALVPSACGATDLGRVRDRLFDRTPRLIQPKRAPTVIIMTRDVLGPFSC